MVLKSWNQLRSVYSMIYNNSYTSRLTFAVFLNHQLSVHGMACSFLLGFPSKIWQHNLVCLCERGPLWSLQQKYWNIYKCAHTHTLMKRRSNKKYHDSSPTSIFLGGFHLWFTSIKWRAFMPHSHTLDHGPQVFHEVLVPGGKMNKSCW